MANSIWKSVYERYGVSNLNAVNQAPQTYTVKAGDTVPAIAAEQFRTGYDSELWRQIVEYNNVFDLEALAAGSLLIVPPPKPSTT